MYAPILSDLVIETFVCILPTAIALLLCFY